MIFQALLEIDPSQETTVKSVHQNKLLLKLLSALTFGAISDKIEEETFTAVSILHEIYAALTSLNINNVIRLSVDNFDFYLDKTGVENDLEHSLLEFESKVDPIESNLFNNIYLVLEHDDAQLKYLIEIKVLRKHKLGDYPIKINFNGVINEFKLKKDEKKDQLISRIKTVFEFKDLYNTFVNYHKTTFNNFINELESAIKKHVKVDDTKRSTKIVIINPRTSVEKIEDISHDRFSQPAFYGYYGFDYYFFYTLLWSNILFDCNIYVNDFNMVDEYGNQLAVIGSNGFNSSEIDIFNPDIPFETAIHSIDYKNIDFDVINGNYNYVENDTLEDIDVSTDFGSDSSDGD